MISPHTAPGTAIVCRNAGSDSSDSNGPLPRLVVGRVYTLEEIWIDCDPGPFGVALVETSAEHRRFRFDGWKLWLGRFEWVYDAEDFDLAVLPKCLTEITTRVPRRKRELA